MRNKKLRDILIVTGLIFLVLFFLPVGWQVWSDRNYAPGSAWPTIWTVLGVVGLLTYGGLWLFWWNNKK